jgi:undecaprenyl-diphosphatase
MSDVHDWRNRPREQPGPWDGGHAARATSGLGRRLGGFYAAAGRLLAAGAALSLLGFWALFGLTLGVRAGRTVPFDHGVLLWMNRRATPALDVVAREVTALGEGLVVATIGLVAGSLLWLMGRRAYAALLAAGVGGAWIIYPVLKRVFDRPRPRLFEWRTEDAVSSSYPSGHATMAMVLLVLLAYIVHRLSGRRRTSVAATLLAGAAVALIGASRVYLGVHYPSDVIAGYLFGFIWAVFCALLIEAHHARRRTDGAGLRDERQPAGS